jgi:peptidoglycan/LPS O-acetylase OafA/YrhL
MIAGVLFFADLRFADSFGRYFYGTTFAWWSLSLKEQFYVVLPPLAYLCRTSLPVVLVPIFIYQFQLQRTLFDGLPDRRHRSRRFIGMVVVLSVVSLSGHLAHSPAARPSGCPYRGLVARFDGSPTFNSLL